MQKHRFRRVIGEFSLSFVVYGIINMVLLQPAGESGFAVPFQLRDALEWGFCRLAVQHHTQMCHLPMLSMLPDDCWSYFIGCILSICRLLLPVPASRKITSAYLGSLLQWPRFPNQRPPVVTHSLRQPGGREISGRTGTCKAHDSMKSVGGLMLKCWLNEPSKRRCFREIKETLCEILMEERREGDETMSRKNRRVAAISWSSTGSAGNGVDLPPPKPSRYRPLTLALVEVPAMAPNSEVLAQLIRDNETRADAGHYTSPASAFNRFTVEFSYTSSSNSNPASPQHKCKIKGRKNQPVYANIMMADTTPPSAEIAAAAVATNPAPYRDVRISACRVEQQCTPPHLVGVCMEPNEPSHEPHMEQERKIGSCANSNGSRERIVAGWAKKRAIW
ncbi:hypothetical protein DAPPUDRAFT_104783 [Daphnia pulex]|uniref:Uncharacterized protein n=1 Tax=Daphnia pulex TaxID=6669 RepID=E9GNC6_DAPPU|nr:hypothetical protein DAPPUDRAFT_104783 [Daphnia pulex]|eukprot:EFX79007.1 hypothetical protein DAPPUDRAFT_104783 [Daphnia pulex]